MALTKQNVNISFAEGLDTKTDPRQVVPGKLEVLQNSRFTTGMELTKRNGYQLLTTTTGGVGKGIAAYNDEIISYDRYALESYSSENTTNNNKGFIQPVDVTSTFVYTPADNGSGNSGLPPISQGAYVLDSAVHPSGYILYVFSNRSYIVVAQSSNQIIVPETLIKGVSNSTSVTRCRCFVLGNYFIIAFDTTGAVNTFQYCSIPISNLGTQNSSVNIGVVNSGGDAIAFDGAVYNNVLYLAWADTEVGNTKVNIVSIDSSLVKSSTTAVATEAGSDKITSLSVWVDSVPATPNVWISYYDETTTKLRYAVVASNNFSSILSPTDIATVSNVGMITGITIGSSGHLSTIYYEQNLTYSYNSVNTNSIWCVTATDGGTVGTPNIIQRGASIWSRAFQIYSDANYNYLVIVYGPQNGNNFEPTYFVINHHVYNNGSILNSASNAPNAIAKLAQGNAFPYYTVSSRGTNFPQTISALSTSKIQFAIAKSTNITIQGGIAQSTYSICTIIIDFNNANSYQFQNIGSVMQQIGGFLWMYDSRSPVEQNFHLFPEDIATSYVDSGGSIAKNPADTPYQYIVLYQWTDAQGNIHRSAPSTATSIDVSGSATNTNTITVKYPTLRLTEKSTEVIIKIYRNTPTAPGGNATDVFYLVATQINNSSVNDSSIGDTASDSSIIGNELLYTTGGIVENSGGPPCISATIFKSRLFVVDAENRNTLWFSKQVLQNTPVEMSQSFTLFTDPRFGNVTAISVMDDKLIVFKQNAIFYITGNGPDNTGANNDFSDATFISSNTGCVDPRSIVTTQDGLMFKSNKGIYLLDRGLGVTYIGAPVESYNSSRITSAQLIPNSTQVQFTLDDSNTCLMYDYFYKQWSTYTNHNAVGATIYNNNFTYIDPSGNVFEETPGVYSDNGTAILQSLTTSWLSFAQLQGYERIYRLYLLTQYLSPHLLSVGIAYDFNTSIAQTISLDQTALAATNGSVGQWRVNISKQKCQSIQITISEQVDPNNTTPGAGLNLEAIGVLVGAKLTYPKLPATQSVTS